MNKEEFLRQLEQLLSGISAEERADAVAFYRNYFEDAGAENEQAVIEELESPQKAAESILKDFGIDTSKKEADDSRYYNTFANRDAEYYRNVNSAVEQMNGKSGKKRDAGMTALIITVAVLTSPIWLTLLLVLASLVFAAVCVLFSLGITVVAVMASFFLAGFILGGIGVAEIAGGAPAVGIGLTGAGLLLLAAGILALLLVILVCGRFLPWAVKGIWKLCKKPFEKRKERAAV